jgi:hypothetical protein
VPTTGDALRSETLRLAHSPSRSPVIAWMLPKDLLVRGLMLERIYGIFGQYQRHGISIAGVGTV